MSIQDRQLIVPARLRNQAGPYVLGLGFCNQAGPYVMGSDCDTGNAILPKPVNVKTLLSPGAPQAEGIDQRSSRFSNGETIYGVNLNPVKSRIGPIGTLRLGHFAIPGARAQVMNVPALQSFGLNGPAMILGLDLMRNLRLVYDHKARRFWFDHSKCMRPPQ